ncbi:MAG: outer membrane protein transport protein [Candidatus Eisenbacteria bacterium]|nr:outer membrane protein transport protein [Candidatus Eisenbacteria bacterium]
MRPLSVVVVSTVLVLAASGSVSANGFLVPSVGAKASGLAGAFIGLADDYSAAFWNPAGIMQIKGTDVTLLAQDAVSLGSREGVIAFDGAAGYSIPVRAEVAATADAGHRVLPGIFLYPKFSLGALFDKVGLAAYTFADYGTRWAGDAVYDDIVAVYPTQPSSPLGYRRVMGEAPNTESRLTSYAISPLVAKEIVPGLSFGLAGHAVYTSLETKLGTWYEERWVDTSGPQTVNRGDLHPIQMEDSATGWGYCATAGIMFKATDALSFGAVVRTPMTVAMAGEIEVSSTHPDHATPKQDQEYDLVFPMWAGLGIAYRDVLVDGLTLTVDGAWTQWSKYKGIARVVDAELPSELHLDGADPEWKDTIEVGAGLDYRLSRALSMRAGYRNVPSPGDAEHYTAAFPQIAKNAVAAGMTYRSSAWHADLSLEYQIGEKLIVPANVNYDNNGEHVGDLVVTSLSLTYAF